MKAIHIFWDLIRFDDDDDNNDDDSDYNDIEVAPYCEGVYCEQMLERWLADSRVWSTTCFTYWFCVLHFEPFKTDYLFYELFFNVGTVEWLLYFRNNLNI